MHPKQSIRLHKAKTDRIEGKKRQIYRVGVYILHSVMVLTYQIEKINKDIENLTHLIYLIFIKHFFSNAHGTNIWKDQKIWHKSNLKNFKEINHRVFLWLKHNCIRNQIQIDIDRFLPIDIWRNFQNLEINKPTSK